MSASEDVKTLFRRFGGEPESYQEVGKERAVGQALGKWAMLGQVDLQHPQSVSSVRRAVKTADTRPLTEGANVESPLPALHQASEVTQSVVLVSAEVTAEAPATTSESIKELPGKASPALTPLAARLRAQAMEPESTTEVKDGSSHSLPGLFDRLSKPITPATQQGVLRRKFNK